MKNFVFGRAGWILGALAWGVVGCAAEPAGVAPNAEGVGAGGSAAAAGSGGSVAGSSSAPAPAGTGGLGAGSASAGAAPSDGPPAASVAVGAGAATDDGAALPAASVTAGASGGANDGSQPLDPSGVAGADTASTGDTPAAAGTVADVGQADVSGDVAAGGAGGEPSDGSGVASDPVVAGGMGGASAGVDAPQPTARDGLYGFFPTTVTEAEVQAMYESWRTEWTTSCGDERIRVRWDDANKTVSEGIGYGMLLAASWQDRATFDGMLAYYNSHLNDNGLMGWIGDCNGTDDDGAATDADLDVAMALLMAACAWPEGAYGAEATSVISAIDTTALVADGDHEFLCAGDGWGPDCCGNPSYQAPAYYRAFAAHMPETADVWNQAAEDSYYYLNKYVNANTGLMPDWMDPDTLRCDAKDPGDWHGWDASRVPWRVATDYVWWQTPAAAEYSNLVADFILGKGGIGSTCQGYSLDGATCSGSPVSTFAGAFATTGMVRDQSTADAFFSDLKSVDSSGYFNAILNVLYFTLAANRFTPGCY